MIIKLATEEQKQFQAVKNGAVLVGTTLALKNLGHLENELKPDVGTVKRWMYKHKLMKPGLKDTVSKLRMTPIKALQMGAIGAVAGGVLGLGIHKGIKTFKEKR